MEIFLKAFCNFESGGEREREEGKNPGRAGNIPYIGPAGDDEQTFTLAHPYGRHTGMHGLTCVFRLN